MWMLEAGNGKEQRQEKGEKMKTYIGIDPGKMGYIVKIKEGEVSTYSLNDHTIFEWADQIASMGKEGDVMCVMEEVHALAGVGAGTTFSFGKTYGMLLGMLISHKIPYSLVPPKVWQKEIWVSSDKVIDGKKVNTKATSANAAKRLFPGMDLRRSIKCKKDDDNKIDALLIAEYARRKNL